MNPFIQKSDSYKNQTKESSQPKDFFFLAYFLLVLEWLRFAAFVTVGANGNQTALEFGNQFFSGPLGLSDIDVVIGKFFKFAIESQSSNFHGTNTRKDKRIILGVLVDIFQKQFGELEPWQSRFFMMFNVVTGIKCQGIGGGIDTRSSGFVIVLGLIWIHEDVFLEVTLHQSKGN